MACRRLGILLSTPPSHPSVETVVQLAEAALRREVDVYLYLIDEGVKSATDARYLRLIDAGVKTSVCAYGCQQYGIQTVTIDSRVSLSGLVVLSGMINACDRFLAFT